MKYALVDCRIDADTQRNLLNFADKIIKLPPLPSLAPPVASHADMLLWYDGRQIITYSDYAARARDTFSELEQIGCDIVLSEESAGADYPNDIRMNCALVGDVILAHSRHMSSEIKKAALLRGFSIVHTNQGYAKCSCVCVSHDAVITSDPSIAAAARGVGLDVLKIDSGYVRLDGYDTGFIGGASGVTDTNVVFCGNIELHPNARMITDFCKKHGKQAVSLSSHELYDYGTVIFI